MKTYRTVIRPGDPHVNLCLPKQIYDNLKHMATHNHRRLSDEIVARVLATLNCHRPLHTDAPLIELMHLLYNENVLDKK